MSTTLATTNSLTAIEQVLVGGDLSKLNIDQRLSYYQQLCKSLGLNHLTQPFEYITLNGKMKLYAKKDCTDQLRSLKSVSVEKIEKERIEDVYAVTAYVKNSEGRTDSAIGAVPIANLKGEALANALMKAETKAKRRATLSICGLGFLDELEIETITQPLIDGAAKAPHVSHHQEGQADEVVEGVVAEITANEKGTWYKIGDKNCVTTDEKIIKKLAGAHGLKVELLVHTEGKFSVINNVIGIEVEDEAVKSELETKLSASLQQAAAHEAGVPAGEQEAAYNDETGRAAGVVTKVYPAVGKKPLGITLAGVNFSTFDKKLIKRLENSASHYVVLTYVLKDGKYRNISDVEKCGGIDYRNSLAGASEIPDDKELPF